MKASQVSRVPRQIRIIRISRTNARPVEHEEHMDSRIPSSVDSWLSSVPSAKETKVQETPKTDIKQPSPTKTVTEEHYFHRGCIIFCGIVIVIFIICSIVGVILAVKLQSTTTAITNEVTTTLSH